MYTVTYRADGTVDAVTPHGGAPAVVRKRVVADLTVRFIRRPLSCRFWILCTTAP
jgi:hypothetical protein